MKILLVGIAAIVLGLGGGAVVSGTLLRGDIVERLEEEQNSGPAPNRRDTQGGGPGIGAIDPTAVQTSVELSGIEPAAGGE